MKPVKVLVLILLAIGLIRYNQSLVEKQLQQKHSQSGSSLLPPDRRIPIKANGLKSV